ncbi:MAG: diacylglycerol/lipid kinase family protein [Acidimicrobiales bacterium]
MASAFGSLALIVNPKAGGRRGPARLRRLRHALEDAGLEHDVWPTHGPGDATRLARLLVTEECRRFVVAVGGDGTVHEVVNGMLDEGGHALVPEAVLGVVGAGSGCDFIRTFGLPNGPAGAARLGGDETRLLDVARIGYVDAGGRAAVRYFANIAEAGLGAATAHRAATLPRRLGQSRYLVAFWAVLPGHRAGSVRIEVDGAPAYEGRAVNVVLANCRYFGGGMHISPRSHADDGALEVLVFNGRKTDSFTMLPKVYRGSHLPHRNIVELRGHRVRLESDRPLPVEADGEVLGTTGVTVDVLPAALRLKV